MNGRNTPSENKLCFISEDWIMGEPNGHVCIIVVVVVLVVTVLVEYTVDVVDLVIVVTVV